MGSLELNPEGIRKALQEAAERAAVLGQDIVDRAAIDYRGRPPEEIKAHLRLEFSRISIVMSDEGLTLYADPISAGDPPPPFRAVVE